MGFDTVHFRLLADEVGGTDLMAETPNYITSISEHTFTDGQTLLAGRLVGCGGSYYKVSITPQRVTISDCSLSKWELGSNMLEMDRKATKEVVMCISDLLHLPIDRATVTRMDLAMNVITKHNPSVYINHLGALARYTRLKQQTALYYNQENEQFVIYDKLKEQRRAGAIIPVMYQNRNVLRLEQRYKQRISKRFGIVTGKMLYDEQFYNILLSRLWDTYNAVKKINDYIPNFKVMATNKDFYKMGVMALIEKFGGQNEMLDYVKEAQQTGTLSRMQASRIRKLITDVGKVDEKIILQSEVIKELNEKVKTGVKILKSY